MTYESKKLYVLKGEHRTAMVKTCSGLVPEKYKYSIDFYYDGYPDYEWKKGSGGVACELCETLEQAKRKAKYYVNKDNL